MTWKDFVRLAMVDKTATSVANETGINRKSIESWMNGKFPTLQKAEKFCKTIGKQFVINPDNDLLTRENALKSASMEELRDILQAKCLQRNTCDKCAFCDDHKRCFFM